MDYRNEKSKLNNAYGGNNNETIKRKRNNLQGING